MLVNRRPSNGYRSSHQRSYLVVLSLATRSIGRPQQSVGGVTYFTHCQSREIVVACLASYHVRTEGRKEGSVISCPCIKYRRRRTGASLSKRRREEEDEQLVEAGRQDKQIGSRSVVGSLAARRLFTFFCNVCGSARQLPQYECERPDFGWQ